MTTGEKIRRLRVIKGIKQESFAKEVGLSVNQYGKLERGEAKITVERLEQIAEKLGITSEDILNFDEEKSVVINNPKNSFIMNREVNNYGIAEVERKLYVDNIKMLQEVIKMKDEIIRLKDELLSQPQNKS